MSGWRQVKCHGCWLAMLLHGCDGADIERLDSKLAAVAAAAPVVEVVAVLEPTAAQSSVPEVYLHAAGRSPFRLDSGAGDPEPKHSILAQYPLEVLTLRGTVVQGDERWALVASPDGRLHRLGMAQHMARDKWQVTDIGMESMTLVTAGARRVLWLGGADRE